MFLPGAVCRGVVVVWWRMGLASVGPSQLVFVVNIFSSSGRSFVQHQGCVKPLMDVIILRVTRPAQYVHHWMVVAAASAAVVGHSAS